MTHPRAAGVLLGTAVGDALGAGYEVGPPLADDVAVDMIGGGPFGWAPGEWTDDTSMAVAVAQVAATGADLRTDDAQDRIVASWYGWSRTAQDVGNQTRIVLDAVGPRGGAGAARAAARHLHEQTGRTAGNGSLMRTAPVALAFLDDVDGLTEAALAVSALTHHDPEAGEACVLWSQAIRSAVVTDGVLDVRVGLGQLDPQRAAVWAGRIDVAERSHPRDFPNNGWVVEALQAAWSAAARTGGLVEGLRTAVRGGNDTDTVAAIAGGLLGARYGSDAVPARWRSLVHGWPGLDADGLDRLTEGVTRPTPG